MNEPGQYSLGPSEFLEASGVSIYFMGLDANEVALEAHGPVNMTASTATDETGHHRFYEVPHRPNVVGVRMRAGDTVYFSTATDTITVTLIRIRQTHIDLGVRALANDPAAGIAILWDPEVVSPEDYAELVTAVGDVVRASGGLGVERITAIGYGVPVAEGVPS